MAGADRSRFLPPVETSPVLAAPVVARALGMEAARAVE